MMHWTEYDERAMQIAEEIRGKFPLFEWRVCDAATRAPYWRALGMPEYGDWAIRAQARINGHTLRAEIIIDAHLMDLVKFDMLDYVATQMAHEFANRFLEWKPDSQ